MDKKAEGNKTILKGYDEIIHDVRVILEKGLRTAHRAVDYVRLKTYWEVGKRMVEGELANRGRADYGSYLVKRLAKDLGFSRYELSRMMDFYRTYPIVATVPQQLSWSHIRELLPFEKERRTFYEAKAVDEKWSVRELRDSIKRNAYQEFKKTTRSLPIRKIPERSSNMAIFKRTYQLDFLGLDHGFSERELEDALIERVINVLTELGKNFSLVGRQVKILIDGNWDKIDLIFYHTRIHCFILVELKRGKFKKEYVGQINCYIEYYRHNEETEGDNPTIGLILCEDVGYEEAVYALGGLEKKIFVSRYRINLPSAQRIIKKLKEANRHDAEIR